MIKTIGYYFFAFVFYICRLLPIKENRIFCIMTHDDGESGNVMLLIKELEKLNMGFYFNRITGKDVESVKKFGNMVNFFLVKPYQMARAKTILMDNVFMPLAYIRVRKDVKVVQLWHGT